MSPHTAASAAPPSAGTLDNLVEQFAQQIQQGEAIDIGAFANEHPEHAKQLQRILPAMQILADLERPKPSGPAADEDTAGVPPVYGVLGGHPEFFRLSCF